MTLRLVVTYTLISALSSTAFSDRSHQPPVPTAIRVLLERNRFQPRDIRAHSGDTIRFVNGEGGPHNVEFEKDSIARAVRPLIEAAMGTGKIGPMSSALMILTGETFTFVVPALPTGRYAFLCSPHWGNMKGALVVER